MRRTAADVILDSDVVIWLLRGRRSIVDQVLDLSNRGRLGISVVTWTKVVAGMRESERQSTLRFLDSCVTLDIDREIALRGGEIMLRERQRGLTLKSPDTLIAATAIEHVLPLYTCNARHYPMPELDLHAVEP